MGVGITKVDLAICRSMNLIIDCPDGTMRFKDTSGRAWNPNDSDAILAIEDIPNRPRPRPFPGSSSQGGIDFPNLVNVYNIMQETLQVSKNDYSLGQSSSSQISSMECNILTMQNDITYIRDHMVIQGEEEEDEGEGQDMDSDYAIVAAGDVVVVQVNSPDLLNIMVIPRALSRSDNLLSLNNLLSAFYFISM
ncbi:hypothetical protein Hanom_Chr12g01104161 [Helianthus anomalus]